MAAEVNLRDVTRTCMGLAGLFIDAVRAWAEREIGETVGGTCLLCGDEQIALDGAFRGGPGILVIAGTGSNSVGRAADGTMYRAGGWGPALGDEGSGNWIGQEALRAGFWAKDRGVQTALLTEIGSFWEIGSLGEIVERANLRPGPDFAALVPTVARCAEAGDELAIALLERAGAELAEQVALVALKMRESGGADDIQVAYTGGVIENIDLVCFSMIEALQNAAPEVMVMESVADALEGALWLARNGKD